MAYYAIGERRVRPGEMEAFVQATRRFGDQIARAGAPQEAFQLYVAEDDPEVALLVGRWPHPDRMAAAPLSYAYLGEYADEAVVHAVRAATADIPQQTPLRGWRRFAGRIGYWWDRPGQRDLE